MKLRYCSYWVWCRVHVLQRCYPLDLGLEPNFCPVLFFFYLLFSSFSLLGILLEMVLIYLPLLFFLFIMIYAGPVVLHLFVDTGLILIR